MESLLFLKYLFRTAAVLAVLCVFFNVFLREETFHKFNRWAIFVSCIAAFIVPLFVFTYTYSPITGIVQITGFHYTSFRFLFSSHETAIFQGITTIYFVGVFISLLIKVLSIISVSRKLRRSREIKTFTIRGRLIKVYLTEHGYSFSWMNNIVISEQESNLNEINEHYILKHECGHVLARHSYDIIFIDILVSLQWFNPFAYLFRQYLKDIQEFQADSYVADSEPDRIGYLSVLLKTAMHHNNISFSALCFVNSLKDRIVMLSRNDSSSASKLKVCYIPIVLMFCLYFFAEMTLL